jgi:translation initiation factor IF-2
VKADAAGSLEALTDEIKKIIPEGVSVKIFDGGVGEVGESDVKFISSAKKALIVGFHVKVKGAATDLAERFGISIRTFEIIYEAIDWMKEEFQLLVPKEFKRDQIGKMLVLKTFRSAGGGRIIGGRVRDGRVEKGAHFEILRGSEPIGEGKVLNVQRNKGEVDALREDEEGGLLVESRKAIEERDVLNFFHEREA